MAVHAPQDRQNVRARIDGHPFFKLPPENRASLLQCEPGTVNELAELLYNTPSLYGRAMKIAQSFAAQDGRITTADSVRRDPARQESVPQSRPDGVVFWETFRAAFCSFPAGEGGSFCAYFSESLRRALLKALQKEQECNRYLKTPSWEMKRLMQTVGAINEKRQELGLTALNPANKEMTRAAAQMMGKTPAQVQSMLNKFIILGMLIQQEYDQDGHRLETADEADSSMDPQEVFLNKESAVMIASCFQMLRLREKELNFERYGDLYSDHLLRFLRGDNENASDDQRNSNVETVQILEKEGILWGRMMRQDYAEYLLTQPPELNRVPPLAFNPLRDPALKPGNGAVARFRLRNRRNGSLHSEEVKVSRDSAKIKEVFRKLMEEERRSLIWQ